MAFTRIAFASATSANGQSVAALFNSTGANLLVAFIEDNVGVGATVFGDSKGNAGWVLAREVLEATYSRGRLYYCLNPASVGPSHQLTAVGTVTNQYPTISIAAYAGAVAADQNQGGSGGFTNVLACAAGITPTEANELFVSGFGGSVTSDSGPTAITAPFTIRASVNNGANGHASGIADEIQTTATFRNPTWTTGSNFFGGTTVLASFKTAAPAIPLAANSSFAFSTTGVLSLPHPLVATSSFRFATAATLIVPRPLAAATSFAFATTANLRGSVALGAFSSLFFQSSGDLTPGVSEWRPYFDGSRNSLVSTLGGI